MMVGGGTSVTPFLTLTSVGSSSYNSIGTSSNISNSHQCSTTIEQPYPPDICNYGPVYSPYTGSYTSYGASPASGGGGLMKPRSVTPYARASPAAGNSYGSTPAPEAVNTSTAAPAAPMQQHTAVAAPSMQQHGTATEGVYNTAGGFTNLTHPHHHMMYRAASGTSAPQTPTFQDYSASR